MLADIFFAFWAVPASKARGSLRYAARYSLGCCAVPLRLHGLHLRAAFAALTAAHRYCKKPCGVHFRQV
jgi:uncharacterized membrane protein YccC